MQFQLFCLVLLIPDTWNFEITSGSPFFEKLKLNSLESEIRIQITQNDTVDNLLEIYITFCKEKLGSLYTSTFSSKVDIFLKPPLLLKYYGEYSCDNDNIFFTNTTQPINPLYIRLESNKNISGEIAVTVDGEGPHLESHVASYESGTYTIDEDNEKMVPIEYHTSDRIIHFYVDVVSGEVNVFLSPCLENPRDIMLSNLERGSHTIEIDIDQIMENTTCPLISIDPTTLFTTFSTNHFSATFTIWRPGAIATWYMAVAIGGILLALVATLLLINHLGRRKTGQLIINN